MATPPEVLASLQAARGDAMQRRPKQVPSRGMPGTGGIAARGPYLGFKPAGGAGFGGMGGPRGGRMPVDPMKPGGFPDVRPPGPTGLKAESDSGGIVPAGAGGAPQKPAWQVLQEAGIGGQGSAEANKAMAAKLAGGSPSGGIAGPTPIGGAGPVGGAAKYLGFKPAGGVTTALSTGGGDPGIFNKAPGRPASPSGGIVPDAVTGATGAYQKEMPAEVPDVKAMPMPAQVPQAAPPGMGATVSDPTEKMDGGGGFSDLAKIGAQFRRRPPQQDFEAV